MPGHITSSGTISFSDLNETKNIKKATSWNQENTSLSSLRDWYYNHAGDISANIPSSNSNVAVSKFRDSTVFGFQFYGRNETATTYHNAENVGVAFKNYPIPPTGDDSTMKFRLTGPAASKWNSTYSGNVAGAVDSTITVNPGSGSSGVASPDGRQAWFDSYTVDGSNGQRVYMQANIPELAEGSQGNDIQLVGTNYETAVWEGPIEFVRTFGSFATTTTTFTISGVDGDYTSTQVTITDTIQGYGTHAIQPVCDGKSTLNHMLSSPDWWGGRYTLIGNGLQIPVIGTSFTVTGSTKEYETLTLKIISDDQGVNPVAGEGNGWTSDLSQEETLLSWLGGFGVDLNFDDTTANQYWAKTVRAGQRVGPLEGGSNPMTVNELINQWNANNIILKINTSNVIGGSVIPSPGAIMRFSNGLDKGDIDPQAPGSTVAWAYYGRNDGGGNAAWDGSVMSDSVGYTVTCTHINTGTAFSAVVTMGYSSGAATITGPTSSQHRVSVTPTSYNLKWGGSTSSPGGAGSWSDLFYMYIGKPDSSGRAYG